MLTVLTVDDSVEIRAAVRRALRDLGIEVAEAENGAEGLARLGESSVDLILLDISMPVMDGLTMLRALRDRGDRTPVVLLTSETKRAVVGGAVQLGVDDFIVKPFRGDALRTLVRRALRLGPPTPVAEPAATSSVPAEPPSAPVARPPAEILLVDDMAPVHRRLRQLLPERVAVDGAVGAVDALARCRQQPYRVILIDLEMPDVDCAALASQLRALQPQAVVLALAVHRRRAPVAASFDDVVCKPFDAEAITALLAWLGRDGAPIEIDDNLLVARAVDGDRAQHEAHYARLRPAIKGAITRLAVGAHDAVIVDVRKLPVYPERLVRLVTEIDHDARSLGMQLRLVASPETASLLERVAATADVRVFTTIDRAHRATI